MCERECGRVCVCVMGVCVHTHTHTLSLFLSHTLSRSLSLSLSLTPTPFPLPPSLVRSLPQMTRGDGVLLHDPLEKRRVIKKAVFFELYYCYLL